MKIKLLGRPRLTSFPEDPRGYFTKARHFYVNKGDREAVSAFLSARINKPNAPQVVAEDLSSLVEPIDDTTGD